MYLIPPVAFVTKTYLKLLLYLTVLSTIYESALISCQYFNITGVNGQSGFQLNPLNTAVKPAATPKCMVNLAAALFCCARRYSALRRSSAGLSPAFTKPIFIFIYFFLCLTYTYKQEQGNKSKGNIY